MGVRFQLASDDKILGTANQEASPLQPCLYLLLKPFIQDMMDNTYANYEKLNGA